MKLLALTLMSSLSAVNANILPKAESLPRVFLVTTDVSLDIYRASSHLSATETGEGSAPWSPAGIYVMSGEVNGYPSYTREVAEGQDEPLYSHMHLFRGKTDTGIWIMTNDTDNFDKDRGSFITSFGGPTPVGLKWRFAVVILDK